MGSDRNFPKLFKLAYATLFCAALLCAVLAVLKPEQKFQLYPYAGVAAHLFADSDGAAGESVARWLDRRDTSYECKIAYGLPHPYCGLVLKYKSPKAQSYTWLDYFEYGDGTWIDLSTYEGVTISLEYTGESSGLNFYLRNGAELPSGPEGYAKTAYIQTEFPVTGQHDVYVSFDEMHVANWWKKRYNPPPELLEPAFGYVFEIGIDLPSKPAAGIHTFKLNSIMAKKPLFSPQRLFLIFTAIASAALLVFIAQLMQRYLPLRCIGETDSLRNATFVDPLTQCLNRLGLEKAITGLFPLEKSAGLFVTAVALNNFGKIKDSHGQLAADELLRKATAALSAQLRSHDIFGRWAGEEFVIISHISRDNLEILITRLIHCLQDVSFDGAAPDDQLSMSMGVTEARFGETFADVFKRAEEALGQAKQAGHGSWKLV